MLKGFKSGIWTLGVAALCASAWGGRVQKVQTVTLRPGWNAFHLSVQPSQTAEELFADWPVESVALYDSSSFLETKQYSGTESTEGTRASGFLTWRRGVPGGASSLTGVAANGVYLAFNTNATSFSAAVYGTPVASRITWHPSSTNEPMNYVGFSLQAGVATTPAQYFDGVTTGNTTYNSFKIWGTDVQQAKLAQLTATTAVSNGDVAVVSASKVSDWSGVFHVSPMLGVAFSTNGQLAVVSVRNDSAQARTVRLSLDYGQAPAGEDVPPLPEGLLWRESSGTGNWADFGAAAPIEKILATNETLNVRLALDRTRLTGPAGMFYGALLKVTDVTANGSGFETTIPLSAISDGGASSATAWPKGVWLASAVLDEVTYFGTPVKTTNETYTVSNHVDQATGLTTVRTNWTTEVTTTVPGQTLPAGGAMKIRLPMYVDGNGRLTLLQRFWYGSETGKMYRVSTPFLPVDEPEIEAAAGSFGTTATFPFVVKETSKVNPMRHAYHPMHDGLKSDFKTAAPSGDDLENYVSTVKPEVFSITNTVIFNWNGTSGTAWNPDEKVSGTIQWDFDGIRHEGTIHAKGTFTMKRVTKGLMEGR